jgi:hypothetical protein
MKCMRPGLPCPGTLASTAGWSGNILRIYQALMLKPRPHHACCLASVGNAPKSRRLDLDGVVGPDEDQYVMSIAVAHHHRFLMGPHPHYGSRHVEIVCGDRDLGQLAVLVPCHGSQTTRRGRTARQAESGALPARSAAFFSGAVTWTGVTLYSAAVLRVSPWDSALASQIVRSA